jgi:GTP cyclohydrolase I
MKVVSYKEVQQLTAKLAARIRAQKVEISGIFGVPRGGVPIAIELSKMLGAPLLSQPRRGCLVVDDVADSGKTLARYADYRQAVLFAKPNAKVSSAIFSAAVSDKWIQFPWEIQEAPAEDAITRVIEVIGEDPSREGLLDTPKRVLKSYGTLFGGYKTDPKEVLKTSFEGEGYDQIVLLDNIEFYSTCEHHMLPFFGVAHVGYIPRKRVVGLSKLARLVECFSRRLQIQERLTNQIAQALVESLDPQGVGVVLQAQHFCMVARGVQKQGAVMTTSALSGLLKSDSKARSEFLSLIGKGKR